MSKPLRDSNGLQPLETRQKHYQMAHEVAAVHPRTLLANADGKPVLIWSDDTAQRAKFESRGYAVVEDPYKDPTKQLERNRKGKMLTIHVPMQSIGMGKVIESEQGVSAEGADGA